MGRRPTPQQDEWQKQARRRFIIIVEKKFNGHQGALASALGVSHTLVSLVTRGVQPPTRNLMARLGRVEGVNPEWADTGVGDPFRQSYQGSLPISSVLLPGAPADHAFLMNGERFTVAPMYDRPSCYLFRLPKGHPAIKVDSWRLLPGDLLLLENSRTVIESPGGLFGKSCVVDGSCVGLTEPLYGLVNADEKQRMTFANDEFRLRFLDSQKFHLAPPVEVPFKRPQDPNKPPLRRKLRFLDAEEAKATQRAIDPWYTMPSFDITHVFAVQILMIRP